MLIRSSDREDDRIRRAAAREAYNRKNAALDVNAFIEYACIVEGGVRPVQARIHREWQRLVEENSKVVLWAPHYHGKTNQISRWNCLHSIGRNPNLRCALIGETEKLPKKILSGIKADITDNPRVRSVFPKLKPAGRGHPQAKWTDNMITVDRTDRSLDPTVQCIGAYGPIVGARLDRIYIDDLLCLKFTVTEYQREKMKEWLRTEVFSRITKGGKIIFVGTAWHESDIMHELVKRDKWAFRKYAATYIDEETGEEKSLAPELFSLEEIYERANLLGGRDHPAARRMLWNETRADGGQWIKWDWIEKCLARGRGLLKNGQFDLNWGSGPTYSGVDLGASTRGVGARDAIFSLGLMPEGSRRVLEIRSGQWNAPELVQNMSEVDALIRPNWYVENNGIQKKLIQLVESVTPLVLNQHHTGANKHDPHAGVQSMGLEFKKAKWIVPCDEEMLPNDETAAWLDELIHYSPTEHAGDRVMASWIAREAARKHVRAGVKPIKVDLLRR